MMAADTTTSPVRIIILFSLLLILSEAVSAQTAVTPRGQCVYGTYKHEGRDCCLCGIGQKLVEHCTANLQFGKCEACGEKTFSSHPTNQFTCEPCKSCSHENENLEVAEECTRGRNARCKCQKDHYCVSGTKESCDLCNRCKQCGPEGFKVSCSGWNNTICNEEVQGGVSGGAIAGIIFALLIFGAAALGIWYYLRNRKRKTPSGHVSVSNGNPDDPVVVIEEPLLLPKDLQPLLYDIAEVIGWKDMEEVATRSNISNTTIESCKLNHPGDTEEQTRKLLTTWVQSEGKDAARRLIEILTASGKKLKVEKLKEIFSHAS